MVYFFLTIQFTLLLFMALHDWVHLPPLTDLKALTKAHTLRFRLLSSLINTFLILLPLSLTLYFLQHPPLWAKILTSSIYALLTLGTIAAWWIPYLFGSYSSQHKEGFIEYRDTHTFLPPIRDHVIPNTLHVLLHLQVWLCFIFSLFWV